ncbi:MAG: amidohydrolase family protein [Spirochaetaceae bacterium]|nr:amidohydrolase family protein [Spirochaetaceae bacterium]MDT8297254.1 amidohydrolase family protein [Spirochaetaceae bacterium]
MSPQPGVFDFHVHAGDAFRTHEISAYIRDTQLTGLCLLSLPTAGYPGADKLPPHMNEAVLESKKRLSASENIPVYAFGCLDNRDLLPASRAGGAVKSLPSPAEQIAILHEAGFDGLKLWEGKPLLAAALGLKPQHQRLVDACREAGRRDMPVIFHVADPPEFWTRAAGETAYGDGLPGFDELIEGAALLCEQAPETQIVFPHLLFLAGDLKRAASFLERLPNASLDLAPGNYAYEPLAADRETSIAFFTEYSKRILFGTDAFFFTVDAFPLPGDSLEGNCRRCSRLLSFLSGGKDVENPYPLASVGARRVRGLSLPGHFLADILAGNAHRILTKPPKEVGG